MKHLKHPTVNIQLAYQEAQILHCLMMVMFDDDPYAMVSKRLGIDLNTVVNVGRDFEQLLAKAI